MIPFNRDAFHEEFKRFLSGANVTLEFDNVESSLEKVGEMCSDIIGHTIYVNICSGTAAENPDLQRQARELLQRAMSHFCLHEHLIYLIARIKNDGVTLKKNDDETTIFKSQQDELKLNLISTGWFWMNRLIRFLNAHAADFPDWDPSLLDDAPVGIADFQRWVGVADEYFLISIRWIIREVWTECVASRLREPEKTDSIARAVCYEVMGRACTRLAYLLLPEPIRLDINNEMGKNHSAQSDTYIREKVALVFARKAEAYWMQLDVEIKKQEVKAGNETPGQRPVIGERDINQADKFFVT